MHSNPRFRPAQAALCLLLTCTLTAGAQTPSKPMKAEQLMAQGELDNGFEHTQQPAWHIRAHFETFDAAGKQTNAGTFEQSWWGPASYRTTWTSTALNQTDVATAAGLFRTGDQRWPNAQEHGVEQLLHDPLATAHYDPKSYDLDDENRGSGAQALRCLGQRRRVLDSPTFYLQPVSIDTLPVSCFQPNTTTLRYMADPNLHQLIVFNEVGQFGGRYVARKIDVMHEGKASVTIHLLEANSLKDASAPEAPAGATPIPSPVTLPGGWLHMVSRIQLQPTLVKNLMQDAANGDIHIRFHIGADGHVLSGSTTGTSDKNSAELLKELRKQSFAPVLIAGKPAEVDSEVVVNAKTGAGDLFNGATESADAAPNGRRR